MRNIAKISEKDRKALFTNTAAKMGLTDAIVEKDFWVCFVLDYLFHRSKWQHDIAFKGGTSLSKAYRLIERFSEDIDIILDWRILGYEKDEPWAQRSNTKQDAFNKEAGERTEAFLRDEFVPTIIADLQDEISDKVQCFVDPDEPQTVIVSYEHSFEDKAILPVIRLEIGALAAWTPAKPAKITPYAAEYYPRLFSESSTEVLTVLPERTFWEKVTILHREANRPASSKMPLRYSRHYYDLYCIAKSAVKGNALKDTDLLQKVVEFKDKFYHCTWAGNDYAKRGTMKLLPPERCIEDLRLDYEHMQNMIFGEQPDFDKMLNGIAELEKEINEL
jgi:Domain of unknown function (DUF1814).